MSSGKCAQVKKLIYEVPGQMVVRGSQRTTTVSRNLMTLFTCCNRNILINCSPMLLESKLKWQYFLINYPGLFKGIFPVICILNVFKMSSGHQCFQVEFSLLFMLHRKKLQKMEKGNQVEGFLELCLHSLYIMK